MAVALGPTTTTGSTLFGLNYHQFREESLQLVIAVDADLPYPRTGIWIKTQEVLRSY